MIYKILQKSAKSKILVLFYNIKILMNKLYIEKISDGGIYILNCKNRLFLTHLSYCNKIVTILQKYYNMRGGLKKVKNNKRNILLILRTELR